MTRGDKHRQSHLPKEGPSISVTSRTLTSVSTAYIRPYTSGSSVSSGKPERGRKIAKTGTVFWG